MGDIIADVARVATFVFAVSTMLAMGLGLTVREVTTPLRNLRFVIAALLINFGIVPATVWILTELLGLAPDIRIGLLLIACVAGAPMVPKLTQIAKGDVATAVALVVLLVGATVVIAPLLLRLLLPGVRVDSAGIAQQLAVQMLIPLLIGVVVRELWEEVAAEYRPTVGQISNVALAVLILASIGQNLSGLLDLIGTGGILAVAIMVAVGVGTGYLLGVPAGIERRVLALGAGQRNLAAAFVIATGNFSDRPNVLILIGVAGLVMMVILFPLAGQWSKRPSRLATPSRRKAAA